MNVADSVWHFPKDNSLWCSCNRYYQGQFFMRLAAEDSLNKFFVLRKFSRVCVIFVKFVIPKYKYECYFVVSCLFFHADTNAKIKLCKIVKCWRLAAGVQGGRQTIQDSPISHWSNTARVSRVHFHRSVQAAQRLLLKLLSQPSWGNFPGVELW